MKSPYQKHNPKAGVRTYELLEDAIILEFPDHKSRYLYNAQAPVPEHVAAMKHLQSPAKASPPTSISTYVRTMQRSSP